MTWEELEAAVTARSPATVVRRVVVDGADWAELSIQLRRAVDAPPLAALERNFTLAVGALAVVDGMLVLRQLLPLAAVPGALADVFAAFEVAVAEA